MRILLISHLFPKASDPRHGIFVLRQAEMLIKLGHDIEVVSPVPFIPRWLTHIPRWNRYQNQTGEMKIGNFRVHRPAYIRPPGAWFIGYQSISMWHGMRKTVRRLAKEKQFDLVFAQDFCADVGAGVSAGKELGVPSVGMAIGSDLNDSIYVSSRAWRTITNSLMACHGVVCNSEALRIRVGDLTRGQKSAVCITRGTDIHHFTPVDKDQKRILRRQLGWPDDCVVFIYAGYLQADKGVFELVDAFNIVASKDSQSFLVLVGSGADLSVLKEKVAQSRFSDRILFHEYVEHVDIHRYFQASDIIVMPSYTEGMPNSVVEGISCGLPVLATRVGGIPEAAPEGSVSLLVPPKDVDSLVQAALRFCESSTMRIEMGLEARKHAEKYFDAELKSQQLSEFLGEIRKKGLRTLSPSAPSRIQVVDISSNSFDYLRKLADSLKVDPTVVCRASAPPLDPTWYHDVCLREDLMIWTTRLAAQSPDLMEKQKLRKAIRLAGYITAWVRIIMDSFREQTKVIHIQWCMVPLLDMLMFSLLHIIGIRIVYTVHNSLPHGNNSKSVIWMFRQLYRIADALIVMSDQIGHDIEEHVIQGINTKVHVIPHGLLPPKMSSPSSILARYKLGLDEESEIVLFFGKILAYKGISDLIDAFSISSKVRPKLKLYIAGYPEDSFDPYMDQIRNLELEDNVCAYPEYVSTSFMLTLYAAADLAVLPYRHASQSGAGVECLALGKPIIATNTGGLPDLVEHGKTGYLVQANDPSALAESITDFFSQSRDKQLAMAEASLQLGKDHFDWGPIASKHIDLYNSLIQQAHTI